MAKNQTPDLPPTEQHLPKPNSSRFAEDLEGFGQHPNRDFYSQYFEKNIKKFMTGDPKNEVNYQVIGSELLGLRSSNPHSLIANEALGMHPDNQKAAVQRLFSLMNSQDIEGYLGHEEVEHEELDHEDLESPDDISEDDEEHLADDVVAFDRNIQHAAFLQEREVLCDDSKLETDGMFHDQFPEFNLPYESHETDASELRLSVRDDVGIFPVFVGGVLFVYVGGWGQGDWGVVG